MVEKQGEKPSLFAQGVNSNASHKKPSGHRIFAIPGGFFIFNSVGFSLFSHKLPMRPLLEERRRRLQLRTTLPPSQDAGFIPSMPTKSTETSVRPQRASE